MMTRMNSSRHFSLIPLNMIFRTLICHLIELNSSGVFGWCGGLQLFEDLAVIATFPISIHQPAVAGTWKLAAYKREELWYNHVKKHTMCAVTKITLRCWELELISGLLCIKQLRTKVMQWNELRGTHCNLLKSLNQRRWVINSFCSTQRPCVVQLSSASCFDDIYM